MHNELHDIIMEAGADFWGCIPVKLYQQKVEEYREQTGFDKWLQPDQYFTSGEMKSIVVMGLKVVSGNLKNPGKYTARHNITANIKLNSIAYDVAVKLEKLGYSTFSQFTINENDSPPEDYRVLQNDVIPSKMVAVLANLGFMGVHDLFVHHNYGAQVRLITLFTTLDLEGQNTQKTDVFTSSNKSCHNCQKCVEFCPSGAISMTKGYQPEKCWKFNGKLQAKWGYAGCGRCMYVCK